MNKIFIEGGGELSGKIEISGSKNAALPIIAATLLTDKPVVLLNVPDVSDVSSMLKLICHYGKSYSKKKSHIEIHHRKDFCRPEEIFKYTKELFTSIRASCLLLGPMLGLGRKISIKTPGGCKIGKRPIDLHISALQKMGAEFDIKGDIINADAKRLNGTVIEFSKVSVGATQNAMMAAVLAKGVTTIKNAAIEPEVCDLANFLIKIGANIRGIGTNTLFIEGVSALRSCQYKIIPDRIELGTYLIMLAAAGGKVEFKNTDTSHIKDLLDKLYQAKCLNLLFNSDSILAEKTDEIHPVDIKTGHYPQFSTDLQAQFTALMCFANGTSAVTESIFENRLMHIAQLQKMGAKIDVLNNRQVKVHGINKLTHANLNATDLRAGAALLIACVATKGQSTIYCADCIQRGYERIDDKLKKCNIKISKEDNERPAVIKKTTFAGLTYPEKISAAGCA